MSRNKLVDVNAPYVCYRIKTWVVKSKVAPVKFTK